MKKNVTVSTALVEEGDYKGKFIGRVEFYYFDSNADAMQATGLLLDLINERMDGNLAQFGTVQ